MTKVVFPSFSGQNFQPWEMRQLVSALELRFQALESASQDSLYSTDAFEGDGEFAPLVHQHVEADITDLNHISSIFELDDVSGTPSLNQVLIWDGAQFIPADQTGGGGATSLSDLTDVSTTAPTDNQLLQYNSGTGLWEPIDPTAIGISTTLAGLGDTDLTGQAQYDLIFNADGVNWQDTAGQLQWNPDSNWLRMPVNHSIRWSNINLLRYSLYGAVVGDPLYSQVQLLAKFEGADAATAYTEVSQNAFAATFTGNAQLDTADFNFGAASALFDGTTDKITFPNDVALQFGSSDWTIEFFFETDSLPVNPQEIFIAGHYGTAGNRPWAFGLKADGFSTNRVLIRVDGTIETQTLNNTTLTPNTWYHVCIERTGTSYYVGVNGFKEFTNIGVFAGAMQTADEPLSIGSNSNHTWSDFAGHVDDLRITIGSNRYNLAGSATYTVPTADFPQVASSAGINTFIAGAHTTPMQLRGTEFAFVNSTETDEMLFTLDGTDANTAFTGMTDWNIGGLTGDVRIQDGIGLVITDLDESSYGAFNHDGADFNTSFLASTWWDIKMDNLSNGVLFTDGGGLSKIIVDKAGGGLLQLRDGYGLRIYDTTDSLWANFDHGAVDFDTTFGSTTDWNITGLSGGVVLGAGVDLTVGGDLTVSGTTTTINSNTVSIADNIILLNSDETGAPTQDAGLEVERGTSLNVFLQYDETSDRWEFTNDGTAYHNIPISTEYTTDHTALTNIGTNTHAQIDTHIADTTIHYTKASILLDELGDVDLTGAADFDMLYRTGGNWVDTAGNLTWDGVALELGQASGGQYVRWYDTNTPTQNFVQMHMSGTTNSLFVEGTSAEMVMDSVDLRFRDNNTLYFGESNDVGTVWNGTNLVTTALSGNWNITGFTAISAGTVDADFDAITATSYGGVLEANLLDKTASEDITGATWNFTDNVIQRPTIQDYGITHQTLSVAADAATFDLQGGNSAFVDLQNVTGASLTLTLSNPPPTGTYGEAHLIVEQHATAAKTITWPGTVNWIGATPQPSTTANARDAYHLFTINEGATWYGTAAIDDTSLSLLGDLDDVTLTTPADGSMLLYDTGTGDWIDNVMSGDATLLDTGALTIANNAVTFAKMQDINTDSFIGRITAGTGDPENLTAAQATSMMDLFATTSTVQGVVPGSNNLGATYYLDGSGAWSVPTGQPDQNLFETFSVTDTDSGYSWSDFGAMVADTITDTATFVSGANINVDIDPASDAIRWTFDPSTGFNMLDATITRPEFLDYAITHQTLTVTTDAATFNILNGNSAFVDLQAVTGANLTLTITNPPGTGNYGEILLWVEQHATTPKGITWPGTVNWQGATPTLSSSANAIDLFHLSTRDGGGSWYGTYALADAPAAGTLDGLSDTNITTPADGAVLIYDTGTATWRDFLLSGDATMDDSGVVTVVDNSHNHTLTNVTDVTATVAEVNLLDISAQAPTAGWALIADSGTAASWQAIPGGVDTLAGLNDTTITTPADGSLLLYDTGTARWIDNLMSGDATILDTGALTIANDAVTFAKMQNINTASFIGRTTAATGDPENLTGTQATALLDLFSTVATTKGLVPGSNGAGATAYLDGTGTWSVPAGGVADGTVTDSLLRWSGSAWVEETDLRLNTTGGLTWYDSLGTTTMQLDFNSTVFEITGTGPASAAVHIDLENIASVDLRSGAYTVWRDAANLEAFTIQAIGTGAVNQTLTTATDLRLTAANLYDLRDGVTLRLRDTDDTDYAQFRHAGAGGQFITDFVNTSEWRIDGPIQLTDNELRRPELLDYSVTHQTLTVTTDAATFDVQSGNSAFVDLQSVTGASLTLSLTGAPASGNYGEAVLMVEQHATAAKGITWPGSVNWQGATPTLSSTANAIDVFHFSTIDGGTTWRGTYATDDIQTYTTLSDLTDTDITTPADGAVLIYDTGTATWRDFLLSGDVTMDDSGVTTVANDSHTHAFNNLTGKTAGTGEYRTSGSFVAGVVGASGINHRISSAQGLTTVVGTATGGWARGVAVERNSDSARIGGFGFLGDNETLTSWHVGFGESWWSTSDVLAITPTSMTIDAAITTLTASSTDADFDAITATSYGGVLEANLVDKTASETISGTWGYRAPSGSTVSYWDKQTATDYVQLQLRNELSVMRFNIFLNNTTADDFKLARYNDSGVFQETSLGIDATTGAITLGNATTVSGDLTVTGTTTTINSNTVSIADNIIVLNSDEAGAPTQDAGLEIERGTSPNVFLQYDETSDRWEFTNDGSTYYNIPIPSEYAAGTIGGSISNDQIAVGAATANEIEGSAAFVWNGSTFTVGGNQIIGDGGVTNYTLTIDGTDGNAILRHYGLDVSRAAGYFRNPTATTGSLYIEADSLISFREYTGSAAKFEISHSANEVRVTDGYTFDIQGSTATDTAAFNHDDTDFNTTFSSTTDWNITGYTGAVRFGTNFVVNEAGAQVVVKTGDDFVLQSAGGSDTAEFNHTGTDLNLTGTSTRSFRINDAIPVLRLDDVAIDWHSNDASTSLPRVIHHPGGGEYYNAAASVTGALRLTLPTATANRNMTHMIIRGFNYNTYETAWAIAVGYYDFTTPSYQYEYAEVIYGKPPFTTVKFQYNASNQFSIQLGETTSAWEYPRVWIDQVMVSYLNVQTDALATGWAWTLETNETGITNETTVTLTSFSQRTNQFDVNTAGNAFTFLDGGTVSVFDSTNADYIRLADTGSNAQISTNTNPIQMSAASGASEVSIVNGTDLWVRDAGQFRVYDTDDSDYLQIAHDGTDANITTSGGTTKIDVGDVVRISLDASNSFYMNPDDDTQAPVLIGYSANANHAYGLISTTASDVLAYTLYHSDGVRLSRSAFFSQDQGQFGLAQSWSSGGSQDFAIWMGGAEILTLYQGTGFLVTQKANSGVRVQDGSATVPTYSFDTDTNTGFYRKAENHIGVAIGGNAGAYWGDTTDNTTWPSQSGFLTFEAGYGATWEDGLHAITANDGGGNFNIRNNNYYNAGDKYSLTGKATHIEFSDSTDNNLANLEINAAASGTVDTAITTNSKFYFYNASHSTLPAAFNIANGGLATGGTIRVANNGLMTPNGVDMADTDLNRPVIEDYGIKHQTLTVSTDAATLNVQNGNSAFVDLQAVTGSNLTLTLSNPSASGTYCEVNLTVEQHATTPKGITWPGSVVWLTSTPTLSTTGNAIDVFHLFTLDFGTTWYGTYVISDTVGNVQALDDLTDVTITAATTGEYLRYSGSAWVDAALDISDDATPTLGGNLAAAANNIDNIGNIDFGSTVGDKAFWYSNTYYTGIEANTLYHRSATLHRWYIGVTPGGGTNDTMELSATTLTVNADITSTGAISGSTIGGITEANLLDKTATENITGSWSFDVDTIGDIQISRNGTTGASGLGFNNDDGVKGYLGFDDAGSMNIWNSSTTSVLTVSSAGNLLADGDIDGATVAGITSANLVDKSATESIAGIWTFTGVGGPIIQNVTPRLYFRDTDATANEKNWIVSGANDTFVIGTATDASPGSVAASALTIARTGTTVDSTTVNGNLTLNDNLTFDAVTNTIAGIQNQNLVDKSATETVSGAWTFSNASSSFPAAAIATGSLSNGVNSYFTASGTSNAYKVPFMNYTGTSSTNASMLFDNTAGDFTYNPSTQTLSVDNINMTDGTLTTPELDDYSISNTSVTPSGTAQTCTYSTSQSYEIDLGSTTGNITITLSGGPPTGKYGEMIIKVTQHNTINRTIVWAGGIFEWPGGTTPVMSTGADAVDIYHFSTWNGGTNWWGSVIQDVK